MKNHWGCADRLRAAAASSCFSAAHSFVSQSQGWLFTLATPCRTHPLLTGTTADSGGDVVVVTLCWLQDHLPGHSLGAPPWLALLLGVPSVSISLQLLPCREQGWFRARPRFGAQGPCSLLPQVPLSPWAPFLHL